MNVKEGKGRKKKNLPSVSQCPDLKEHLCCYVRLISLVGKGGVCSEAHVVACEGQCIAMVTFLLANLTLFPLCICIQISELALVFQAALSKAFFSLPINFPALQVPWHTVMLQGCCKTLQSSNGLKGKGGCLV